MFIRQATKWLFPSVMFKGYLRTINSQAVTVLNEDANARPLLVRFDTAAITDGGAGYASGCVHLKDNGNGTSSIYINQGDATSCDFNELTNVVPSSNVITAAMLQSGSVTPIKQAASEALTATVAGLTTGAMTGNAFHAVVTSDSAAKQVSLPASSAGLIGKQFTIWVGANGFALITPASSNATINGTDADGTNQADIPANSLSRLTLVNTNTWLLENIGSTGTVASPIIPDND